jgi:hypothetical protein
MPKPLRKADVELYALEAMRRMDVLPEKNWKEFMGCAISAGLSLQAIAEALPCAPSTVSRWHSGKSVPPQFSRGPMKDLLVRIAAERLGR